MLWIPISEAVASSWSGTRPVETCKPWGSHHSGKLTVWIKHVNCDACLDWSAGTLFPLWPTNHLESEGPPTRYKKGMGGFGRTKGEQYIFHQSDYFQHLNWRGWTMEKAELYPVPTCHISGSSSWTEPESKDQSLLISQRNNYSDSQVYWKTAINNDHQIINRNLVPCWQTMWGLRYV